jgi:hypothetical protein
MKDLTKDCVFCQKTFTLRDEVTALARKADDPFSTVLYGLRAYIDSELDVHMVSHRMEPEAVNQNVALHNKEIEVVGRVLAGFKRDCGMHGALNTSALDGAARGCVQCLEALVRKARETPVFSAEDAAAVDKLTK